MSDQFQRIKHIAIFRELIISTFYKNFKSDTSMSACGRLIPESATASTKLLKLLSVFIFLYIEIHLEISRSLSSDKRLGFVKF